MACTEEVFVRVFLFVFLTIIVDSRLEGELVGGSPKKDIFLFKYPRNCKYTNEQMECKPVSSCQTHNIDFTSLTLRKKELYILAYYCGQNNDENLICCLPPVNETDTPTTDTCGADAGGWKLSNGYDINIDEFPWMALLEHTEPTTIDSPTVESPTVIYRCTGSLINNRYVMTAAHCLSYTDKLNYVLLGKYDWNKEDNCRPNDDCAQPTVKADIAEKIYHEHYSNLTLANDIALIRLKKIIYYTFYIAPVCLPWNVDYTERSGFRTIGVWGEVPQFKNKKQAIIVTEDFKKCEIKMNEEPYGYHVNKATQICGGRVKGKGIVACLGDSGGPVMSKNRAGFYVIEGIISYGPNDCGKVRRKNNLMVFTKVSSFKEWIEGKIK